MVSLVFTAGAQAGVDRMDWSPGAWRRLGTGASAAAGLHMGGKQRHVMPRALPCVQLGGALLGRRSGHGSRSSRGRRGRTSSPHGGTAQGRWETMEQRTRAGPGAGTPRRRAAPGSSTLARHPGSLRPGAPWSLPGDSERPVLACPHPGSWVRGLGALWELRVFHVPVLWGFVLSWVY